MAKIPDIRDLGGRSSIKVQKAPANFERVSAGLKSATAVFTKQAEETGAGAQALSKSLSAAAATLGNVQERMRSRENAVFNADKLFGFRDGSAKGLRDLQTEGDFSDPQVGLNFIKGRKAEIQKILDSHTGSLDSKARLEINLRQELSRVSSQVGGFTVAAQTAQMTRVLDTGINALTSQTYNSPGDIAQTFNALDALIDDMAPGLTPEQEFAFQANGRERIAAAAVETFLDRGLFTQAREVMQATPGLIDVMSPETQRRLNGRIAQFQRAQFEAETAGRRKVETAEVILGQKLTPAQRVRLAGLAPPAGQQTVSDKIGEIEAAIGRPLTKRERANAAGLDTPQAASPEGKVIQDRQMFISQFGEGSEQVAAFDALSRDPGGPPNLSDIGGQRKEFTRLSGVFVDVRDSFNRVTTSIQTPSAAGDLALIFNFMKMLDPGSVVRESEFAQAAATGSLGQRFVAVGARLLEGKRLSDTQRKDFANQAELLMVVQLRTQLQLEAQFRDLAQRAGIDPDDVTIDFIGPFREMFPGAAPASSGQGTPTRAVPRLKFDLNGNRIGG